MQRVTKETHSGVAVGFTVRRPELQALRALAVVAVVLNHSWPGIAPGGYVGVDIFFVVSGFLITRHLVREHERTGTISLKSFYLRRARRLLPAATIVLMAVAVMTFLVVPMRDWQNYFSQIGASALYVQNWALLATTNGADTAVRHFWSLSVEEQFYLAWPLLVLAGIAAASYVRRAPRGVLLAVLGTVAAASFVYSILTTPGDYQLAYFSTFSRAWEFAVGGLLALLPAAWRVTGRAADLLFWVGLALVMGSIVGFTDATAFPGALALIPVVGTLAIVFAANDAVPASARAITNLAPVQWTGDISYALYLWHWPVLVFAPLITGVPSESWFMVLLLGFAVMLSWGTTRFIENPVRRTPLQGAQFKTRRVVAMSGVVAGLALVVSLSVAGAWLNAERLDQLACVERGASGL